MNTTANKVINEFLDFGGEKTSEDFIQFLKSIRKAMVESIGDEEAFLKLSFIHEKMEHGLSVAVRTEDGKIDAIVNDTEHDLQEYYEKHARQTKPKKGKRKTKEDDLGKLKPKKELGKIVDEGDVPYKGRADQYWHDKLKIVFTPNNKQIRFGAEIPKSYQYDKLDFVEGYYGLRAIEFGNWLSQQDRLNYLSGLGLALFDLHQVLGFTPKQISLRNKLSVAFGARGRGNTLAHFEAETFAINITRYSRPPKVDARKRNFDRDDLLTKSGGVGSFAHEYGHALDYYGGMYIEKTSSGALSGGRSERANSNKNLLSKNTLEALMEKLIDKIIWQKPQTYTTYYARLKKAELADYYFRRNELFARAFETYVHFKMQKKKYKNIFLAELKYNPKYYMSIPEMRRLEKDFDNLINAIKRKL
ncbi:MAG: LPD1 domain-containing protein [Bacteroidota bacterium]|nr:LPD1 domain-containing protein [Bacteroidota bacterium]